MNPIHQLVRKGRSVSHQLLLKFSPARRAQQKYASELNFWRQELIHIQQWYEGTASDWWGLPPPSPSQKQHVLDVPVANAVMTLHAMRPTYVQELLVPQDFFRGKRVLEVGCGPLAPILQFADCERHGIDPLVDLYVKAGWPLYAYDATFTNARAEEMPYVDAYFDAVISVNALDHVDEFEKVAAEIERVLKPGGGLYFEIEYHTPRECEPQRLDDRRVLNAFKRSEMKKVREMGMKDLFLQIGSRHDLVSNENRLAVWHGRRQ